MSISSEDITKATANETWQTVRRLAPLVAGLRRELLAAGIVVECDECAGRGYPGVARLADCRKCDGAGIRAKN